MDSRKLEDFKSKIGDKHHFKELLAADAKPEVIEILFTLICSFAEKGKFNEANALRDWIIEIDPMALNRIIQAAQVIDDAKFAAIDSDHFMVWMSLAKVLSREEFAALYHNFVPRNFQNNTPVLKQGTFFPALIFINRGRLELSTFSDGKTVFLKTVESGEIIGSSTFFDPSTWTFSIKSKGAEVSILTHKNLQLLKPDYPSLESKLSDYCSKYPEPDSLLRVLQNGRRAYKRNRVDGRTAILLLDRSGSSTGTGVNGDLFDISKGGISCLIRTSQKTNAARLFGQKIRASLPLNKRTKTIRKEGVIVAVKGYQSAGNEYSLHVEFKKLLNDTDIRQIVHAGRA